MIVSVCLPFWITEQLHVVIRMLTGSKNHLRKNLNQCHILARGRNEDIFTQGVYRQLHSFWIDGISLQFLKGNLLVLAQNNAFAGVGRPINEVVCRVSILNLPNRSAENTAIMNAVYGKISEIGCMNAG